MNTRFHLKLVTPTRTVFEQEVDQVIAPTKMGQITVLPDHAPLVSILSAGELVVSDAGKKFPLAVAGGVIEIVDNTMYVLADSAEHAEEIDLVASEKRAEELAKQLAAEVSLDLSTYSLLEQQLERERARVLVAQRWRK